MKNVKKVLYNNYIHIRGDCIMNEHGGKGRRILFVEDDAQYRETLIRILENERYYVDAVGSALEAIGLFTLNHYDLVISDLMMEAIDGIQFLQYIKNTSPDMKTMILTAEPSTETEIQALDIYVDKYLVKGTSYDVLIKHIDHLLIQPTVIKKSNRRKIYYELENITLDMITRTVWRHDEKIAITTKEFDVLSILMENMGVAMSREEIISQIWDEAYEKIDERVIDVHIRSIRRKLKTQAILSIRGYGYKWDI